MVRKKSSKFGLPLEIRGIHVQLILKLSFDTDFDSLFPFEKLKTLKNFIQGNQMVRYFIIICKCNCCQVHSG